MQEDFFNKSLDELRVIETDDGEKWVNLDDLIISMHFQAENIEIELNEESYEYQDPKYVEENLNNYKSAILDIIDSLEEIHKEFNNQEDNF